MGELELDGPAWYKLLGPTI